MDRTFSGRIWHSRDSQSIKSQQVGVEWLRAPHQLGRRQAGKAPEDGTEVAFIEREAANKK
jgi:hypothetical protein